jgi:hypothetical protein
MGHRLNLFNQSAHYFMEVRVQLLINISGEHAQQLHKNHFVGHLGSGDCIVKFRYHSGQMMHQLSLGLNQWPHIIVKPLKCGGSDEIFAILQFILEEASLDASLRSNGGNFINGTISSDSMDNIDMDFLQSMR